MNHIKERQHIDFATFHNEIVPANEPVVIRSLVAHWPAVEHGTTSIGATCEYFAGLDNGSPVYTIAAPPNAGGRFFYEENLKDLNFKSAQIPLAQVLAQLQAVGNQTLGHALAVQALSVRKTLPNFEAENPATLTEANIEPTMWIGNRGRVAPHYDVHRNLACVVAGKRQFILFPPEQLANLYLGPVLGAPGGVPISLVDVWNPDLEKFPRFAEALETATEAVLEPGDAIYIPSLWWHGVASLEPLNVLVNYWWGGIADSNISPNDSLLHAMLTIAGLDDPQRKAWRAYFDHYVFRNGADPAAHLPTNLDDIVTKPSAEQLAAIADFLASQLKANS